ncbi:unnamed protein product [Cylindrotheca closterium]|uniref:Protein kinase domain-containing protein n=1 Tax=Cylindrotheca closterium TaxID=2856 RepID=A0AAD2G8P6_9STRA|nr:unnamed protein product [Cylindrotheca closterium]
MTSPQGNSLANVVNNEITASDHPRHESHNEYKSKARQDAVLVTTVENWDKRKDDWEKLLSDDKPLENDVVNCIQSTLRIKLQEGNADRHAFIAFMEESKRQFDFFNDEQKKVDAEEAALQKKISKELASSNIASRDTVSGIDGAGQKRKLDKTMEKYKDNSFVMELFKAKVEAEQKSLIDRQGRLKAERKSLKDRQGRLKAQREKLIGEVQNRISDIGSHHKDAQGKLDNHASFGNETTVKSHPTLENNAPKNSRSAKQVPEKPSISEVEVKDFLSILTVEKKDRYLEKLEVLADNLVGLISLEAPCAGAGRDCDAKEVKEIVAKILDPGFLESASPPCEKKLVVRDWNETAAAQPIVHAIIYRLLGIVNLRRLHVSKEQKTRGKNVTEKDRVMDFLVHEIREHVFHAFPSMIEGIVEVKWCERNPEKDDEQINRAANQVVGNFAKRLRGELNFLGIGVDCDLYGVAVSLSKISAVKASLGGVGTKEVSVLFTKTKPIEFLSQDGLQLLACALRASFNLTGVKCADATLEAKLKLPSYGGEDEMTKISIGQLLGSGAFGIVYPVQQIKSSCHDNSEDPKKYFIKIPISHLALSSLEDEAKTLDKLNKEKTGRSKVPNIPRCEAKCTFDFALNGFQGKTYGLLLNGIIGKAANTLDWNGTCNKQHLPSVMEKVYNTLEAAHNRCVYHLDVRPGNIIVSDKHTSHGKSSTARDVDILVIDWGVALNGDEDFSFRGCVPYAHDELLAIDRTPAKPKEVYDWASLLYTYYHLHEGDLPWNLLMEHGKRVCDTGMRKNVVSKWWWEQKQEDEKEKRCFVEAFAKVLPEEKIA